MFVSVALWCVESTCKRVDYGKRSNQGTPTTVMTGQEERATRPEMHKMTQVLDGAVEIHVPPDPAPNISSI